MDNKKEKVNCPYIYRKGGSDAVHCAFLRDRDAQWDFCKYQYFCRQSNRYEVTAEAHTCDFREV